MNNRISLTAQAHSIIEQHLLVGDMAIDATTGNGHDTLFLAKQVGISGKVFGFDLQQQAIDSTQSRLKDEGFADNTQLFLSSHSNMQQCIDADFYGKIKVIMFNLGYLPGSDKSIITETESTLSALEQAIELLIKSGILTIAAYPGHPGGDTETQAIEQWHQQLDGQQYSVKTFYSSEKDTAPRLYIVQKHGY